MAVLAIVMDQYSRRILAWSLTRQRTAAVTCAVLAQAARHRPARWVIFHSDRGSEYMGAPFARRWPPHAGEEVKAGRDPVAAYRRFRGRTRPLAVSQEE